MTLSFLFFIQRENPIVQMALTGQGQLSSFAGTG